MPTTSPREAWVETFLRASAETADARLVADQFLAEGWRPPLPGGVSEEWGYRRADEPDSYALRTTDEDAARDIVGRASAGPWVVCKRTAPGPWTAVTS